MGNQNCAFHTLFTVLVELVTCRKTVSDDLTRAYSQQYADIVVLILILIISALIIILVRNATLTYQVFARKLAKKAKEVQKEKVLADRLLFQMLPSSVAKSLQQKKEVEAETFEAVTVYFSDIYGFDALSAASKPFEVRSKSFHCWNL